MRPSDRLLIDPRYLPYLPLIYVAWADGELTPTEVVGVQRLAAQELAPGIDNAPVLASWLDATQPPSATDLLRVLRRVREVAHRVPPSERRGLARLGLALAQAEGVAPDASVARAVAELEVALELAGSDAARSLLQDAHVDWPHVHSETASATPSTPALSVDRGALCRLLDGPHHDVRAQIRDLIGRPPFERRSELSRSEHRAQVLAWLQELADRRIGALAFPCVLQESEDIGAFVAAFEGLADFDLSLLVKFGVQFGLFGGAIYFLGTEHHHALLGDVAALRLPGCFAMTETGHGSNVRALGTTATFDPATDELVVHTPDRSAWKDYIGNAALHGRLAVVFAQLVVGEDRPGVHAVLVPIRDKNGDPMPGVHIEDDGPKLGLNGVDNGRLAFNQVRIPRLSLLDRYASLDASGRYDSPIASPTKRFFTMLGTLVGGRISVACGGLAAARSALTIAIRYGHHRRQFGPDGAREQRLLDYPSHRERLLPALAENVVLTLTMRSLTSRWAGSTARATTAERTADDPREIESLAAGLKALSTWHATHTIQEARECCGGAGYLAVNRFADLKADTDVFTTFEGDNTVLLQLAARGVLTSFAASLSDRWTGIVRHLADRAAMTLGALDLLTPRRTDAEHLRNPSWIADVLHHRVQQLTWSAAGRIRSRVSDGMNPFEATIEVQDHLLELGRAWTEHHAFTTVWALHDTLDSSDDTGLAQLISLVLEVYGLDLLWTHQAWYLRHDVMVADKVRAMRDVRKQALEQLRTVALDVVGAFGISDEVLGAPIGQRQGPTHG